MTREKYLKAIKDRIISLFNEKVDYYNEIKDDASCEDELYDLAFFDIEDKSPAVHDTLAEYFDTFANCQDILLKMIEELSLTPEEVTIKRFLCYPNFLENFLAVYCVHLIIDDAIKEFQKGLDNSAKE